MSKHDTVESTITKLVGRDNPYRYTVSNNLYLLIKPNDSKYWRFDFKHKGKRNTLALGTYPDVSLFQAVISANKAVKQLNQGFDPALLRKAEKSIATVDNKPMSFEQVARQYGLIHIKGWDDEFERTKRLLERNIFPLLGNKPIDEIKPAELLYAILEIEKTGLDKANRTLDVCSWIYQYAIEKKLCLHNIALPIKKLRNQSLSNLPHNG